MIVTALFAGFAPFGGLQAQSLLIDTAFGDGGRVTVRTDWSHQGAIYSVQPLKGGGYLLVGSATPVQMTDTLPSAMKLTAAGEIDSNWGDDGRFVLSQGGDFTNCAEDLAGSAYLGGSVAARSAIVRVAADGRPDASFATNGVWTSATTTNYMLVTAAPDGLGAFGATTVANENTLRVVRLSSSGTLDATFGGEHDVPLPAFPGRKRIVGVTASASGLLLAINVSDSNENITAALIVRIAPNGALDPTFGLNGILQFQNERLQSFRIQPNGDALITSGLVPFSSSDPLRVRRISSSGTVDIAYGNASLLILPGNQFSDAVHVDGTGSTYVDVLQGGPQWRPGRARILADGTLDTSYGDAGIIRVAAQSGYKALLPWWSATISLSVGRIGTDSNSVNRFLADGSVDTTYHDGGSQAIAFGRPHGRVTAIARDHAGRYLVAGTQVRIDASGSGTESGFLARVTPSGLRDSTWGQGGTQALPFLPASLDIDAAGRILVAGGNVVQRLLPEDGQSDSAFGSLGTVQVGSNASVNDAITDRKGRIVVTGGTANSTVSSTFALRLLSDGTTDSSFSASSLQGYLGRLNRVLPYRDGYQFAGSYGGWLIAAEYGIIYRVNEDGSRDASLQPSAPLPPNVTPGPGATLLPPWTGGATAFTTDRNGRMVAGNGRSNQIVRLLRDGSYDTSFSFDGRAYIATPGSVSMLRDDRITIASGFRINSVSSPASQWLALYDETATTLTTSDSNTLTSFAISYAPVEPWPGLLVEPSGSALIGGTHGASPTIAKIKLGPIGCSFDLDADGRVDATTDGMLLMSFLGGATAETLPVGRIGIDATRWRGHDIALNLQAMRNVGLLDVDGDGQTSAETDGLLILRIMLGFSGNAVTEGAVAQGASRSTFEAIRSYLSSTCSLGQS